MKSPTCVWFHIRNNGVKICLMQRLLHECQCSGYRPDPDSAGEREDAWRELNND